MDSRGQSPAIEGKLNTLCAPFQQGLKIGARALRLAPGGFRRVAEAEIAVYQASAMMILRRDASGGKRVGIGLTLIAQRIEPRRANDRRRKSCKTFRAQRRDAVIRTAPAGALTVTLPVNWMSPHLIT